MRVIQLHMHPCVCIQRREATPARLRRQTNAFSVSSVLMDEGMLVLASIAVMFVSAMNHSSLRWQHTQGAQLKKLRRQLGS